MEFKESNIEYDVQKWLFVPNFYTNYRYILATLGNKPLIVIGINPSTAIPNDLDNTLKSVERLSKSNGFDSFIMFNIYPQRATNPNDLDKNKSTKLHNENMKALEYILSNIKSDINIWAAWGTTIEKRTYLAQCLKDIVSIANKYSVNWKKIGNLSIKGHPHHPLYLNKNSPLEEFNIVEYMKLLL
ncbi:DUF1643 domain-containing protein [Metamycoplasma cloacale]|uniref:DUF1643 domain-containing protein n=2 Tax=Metamycoplasma cloacale TaxID=92401 RepID=A0A2Z4LMH7_9BACT|nr:DUF1643 domain-containing protein [Metamycoplasma cloacale]